MCLGHKPWIQPANEGQRATAQLAQTTNYSHSKLSFFLAPESHNERPSMAALFIFWPTCPDEEAAPTVDTGQGVEAQDSLARQPWWECGDVHLQARSVLT